MDRRLFLRRAALVTSGIVLADLLDLDKLLWEPKRLWTGASLTPTHGVFWPVQLNKRYGYTGLAMALTKADRAMMIEAQTRYARRRSACWLVQRAWVQ